MRLLWKSWRFDDEVGFDEAIFETNVALGRCGNDGIVGDEDDGDALITIQILEHLEDFLGGLGIEVAGGLIGKEDGGTIDESAGDGDALLLTTGELAWGVVHALAEADFAEEFLAAIAGLAIRHARGGVGEGHDDLLEGAGAGEQVEVLKDKAHLAVTDESAAIVGEAGDLFAIEVVFTFGGAIETTQDVHQRGLAGAGGADECDELTPVDGEGDALQDMDIDLSHVESAFNAIELDERIRHVNGIDLHSAAATTHGWRREGVGGAAG